MGQAQLYRKIVYLDKDLGLELQTLGLRTLKTKL